MNPNRNLGGWEVKRTERGAFHLLPVNDERPHDPQNCPCCPEYDDEGQVWVHNSYDGREAYEELQRKVN